MDLAALTQVEGLTQIEPVEGADGAGHDRPRVVDRRGCGGRRLRHGLQRGIRVATGEVHDQFGEARGAIHVPN